MQLAKPARILPPRVRHAARHQLVRYRHLGLRPSDAILVSYPKSGSTWLRFLLAHAITGAETDFDAVRECLPPIGRHRHAPAVLPDGGRLVRTHEPLRPYHGRPGQPVVYLVRDGRKVALSYHAHQERYREFSGSLVEFLDRFTLGGVDGYGTWHEHVLEALEFSRRVPSRFLMVRYEDLRADPVGELARTLAFLGTERSARDLRDVVAANTKDRMRDKEARSEHLRRLQPEAQPFVRPDDRPGWVDLVPPPARERFDLICAAALAGAGFEPAGPPSLEGSPTS